MSGQSTTLSLVVGGALGLAAHHFPRVDAAGRTTLRLADACFLLSGQTELWSEWVQMQLADRMRIARLLRFRPVEVANRNVFDGLVKQLVPNDIAGFRHSGPGELVVDLGRPVLDYVDECIVSLLGERQLRPRRASTSAESGDYQSLLWLPLEREANRNVDVQYRLKLDAVSTAEAPIKIGAPADPHPIGVPVSELRDIAVRLDDAFGQRHRVLCVDTIFSHIEAETGNEISDVWNLRAGPTRILHAPTGVGKNVLAELLACWCADHGKVLSLVVPTNASVVAIAQAIDRNLGALGIDAEVVALTSPNSSQQVAETAARGDIGAGVGMWAMDRLAYGCALPSTAIADGAVDAWQPGSEPCQSLRQVTQGQTGRTQYHCPWKPGCGKFRNARLACTVPIVVTSHMNWLVGALHVPVDAHGHLEENMAIEELLTHRSHIVLIDEIDAFQATMIGKSARGLVLANRRPTPAPLRQLDMELNESNGRVDASVEHQVRAAIAQGRFLAESYTGHLAEGAFRHSSPGRRRAHPMKERWLLPRRWDAWLAAALFGLPEGEQPGPAHYSELEALFGAAGTTEEDVREWLRPVRSALGELTNISTGDDLFASSQERIESALRSAPPRGSLARGDAHTQVTDRLIRRAYLEGLRKLLFRFVYAAPQLQASGVVSARMIADALGQYAAWRAAPYGPLGRALFAFVEKFDPEHPADTALQVNAFGGDPHSYVCALGDVTAIAHLGHPRIVVGMSATSFFPGAPHHHVFTRPTWWVPDDIRGGIKLLASPISDEERNFVRVSGIQGSARSAALNSLGTLLWRKHLEPALRELTSNPLTRHRARLLLATTSYRGARDLAEGLSNAGVPSEEIVLAVPPDDNTPRGAGRWLELPADRLESFGREVAGSVLIAPLARAQRGLNIVDDLGRSLIGSVWLVVRPIPLMDEPAEILAHVHSHVRSGLKSTKDPSAALDLVRQVAGRYLDELTGALPYFRALPQEAQLAIAAETLNGIIQLAGRARRGGDVGEIHLVDYAFIDPNGNSDLPALIRRLRSRWANDDGDLQLMQSLYGQTIDEIFRFADSRKVTDDQ